MFNNSNVLTYGYFSSNFWQIVSRTNFKCPLNKNKKAQIEIEATYESIDPFITLEASQVGDTIEGVSTPTPTIASQCKVFTPHQTPPLMTYEQWWGTHFPHLSHSSLKLRVWSKLMKIQNVPSHGSMTQTPQHTLHEFC